MAGRRIDRGKPAASDEHPRDVLRSGQGRVKSEPCRLDAVRTIGDTTAGKDRRLAHAFRIMGETGGGTFGPAAERSP